MSRKCFVCEKKPKSGNNVSHSNNHTKRLWLPNIQSVNIIVDGKKKKASVCTKCIKANKIKKA